MSSTKFETTFTDAVTKYLTAKNSFEENKAKLTSTKSLFDHGLVARDEYQSAQDTYYSDDISLLQAKKALLDLLKAQCEFKY